MCCVEQFVCFLSLFQSVKSPKPCHSDGHIFACTIASGFLTPFECFQLVAVRAKTVFLMPQLAVLSVVAIESSHTFTCSVGNSSCL